MMTRHGSTAPANCAYCGPTDKIPPPEHDHRQVITVFVLRSLSTVFVRPADRLFTEAEQARAKQFVADWPHKVEALVTPHFISLTALAVASIAEAYTTLALMMAAVLTNEYRAETTSLPASQPVVTCIRYVARDCIEVNVGQAPGVPAPAAIMADWPEVPGVNIYATPVSVVFARQPGTSWDVPYRLADRLTEVLCTLENDGQFVVPVVTQAL